MCFKNQSIKNKVYFGFLIMELRKILVLFEICVITRFSGEISNCGLTLNRYYLFQKFIFMSLVEKLMSLVENSSVTGFFAFYLYQQKQILTF